MQIFENFAAIEFRGISAGEDFSRNIVRSVFSVFSDPGAANRRNKKRGENIEILILERVSWSSKNFWRKKTCTTSADHHPRQGN
jgi:hypothetical protein